jgi:hypothetical protein
MQLNNKLLTKKRKRALWGKGAHFYELPQRGKTISLGCSRVRFCWMTLDAPGRE